MSTLRFTELYYRRGNISNAASCHTNDSSDNQTIASQVMRIIEDAGFTFEHIIDTDWRSISELACAVFGKSSKISKETEQKIRELLIDHHATFSLFSKWVDTACQKVLNWEKVSVQLYVQDIGHPDFLNVLDSLMAKGVNPSLLILEIRRDDCGVINSRVIENLRKMNSLWFRFSLNDLIISAWEINAIHLEKIEKINILPLYIRITKNVLHEMKRWVLKIKENLSEILVWMVRKGVKILSSDSEISEEVTECKKPSLLLLNRSKIEREWIYDIYWHPYAEECLFRPWDGMGVPQALEILISEGITGELMCKQIEWVIPDILKRKRVSVNAYIKDIWAKNFQKMIEWIMALIPRSARSWLIFELLEVKYGSMNEQVLAHLRFLQESGFSIAIDDLLLWKNAISMSEEILFTLHEAGIYLDYIKIDGSIAMTILEWTISESEMNELRQIMHQYSELSGKTMFILEWVQNTIHALQLLKELSMDPTKILFQWRNLNSENFGIPQNKSLTNTVLI